MIEMCQLKLHYTCLIARRTQARIQKHQAYQRHVSFRYCYQHTKTCQRASLKIRSRSRVFFASINADTIYDIV